MRKNSHKNTLSILPIILPLFIISGTAAEAGILLFEGFETDGLGTRYSATTSFSDGADDYFMRTDGFTEASGIPQFSGFSGSYYWAGEDIDANDNPSGLGLLDFTGIDLAGINAIEISLDMAAGSTVTFDSADDFVLVQFRIDAGNWQTALAFQNDGTQYNSSLHQDLDFDGIGEGIMLDFPMQTFTSASFPVTGSLMDLRIDTFLTATGEAVAFDNIQVASVPEPAMTAIIIAVLASILILRKHFLPRRENESRA